MPVKETIKPSLINISKGDIMSYTYKVDTFVPKVKGCGAQDKGWDEERCQQYQDFLNGYAEKGWKLHSSDFREVTVAGCGGGKGAWLVCVFEKQI